MAVRMGLMDRRAAVLLAVITVFMVFAVGYLAFPRGSGDMEPETNTFILTLPAPDLEVLVATSDVVFIGTLDHRASVDLPLSNVEGTDHANGRFEAVRWTFTEVEFLVRNGPVPEPVEYTWAHTLFLPHSAAADAEVDIKYFDLPTLLDGGRYLMFGVWNLDDTAGSSDAMLEIGPVGDVAIARVLDDGSLEFVIPKRHIAHFPEGRIPETLLGLTLDDVRLALDEVE